MKIIGVSGKDRSGKDSVAELLIEHGWFGYSLGEATRRHAKERHKDKTDPLSVKNMTETSNWLRQSHGPDVLLKEAIASYEAEVKNGREPKGLVVFSVRAPIEADFILEQQGELVWVESSDEVRYKRKIDNLREGEVRVDIQEMLAQESLQTSPQTGILRQVQMDLQYVKSKASITIENNGNDFAAFQGKVIKALGHVL